MPLNNGYFSTNLRGLQNSVTRHFYDVGTWFCMFLNMYNKKKKLFFFRFLQPKNGILSRRILHILQRRVSTLKNRNLSHKHSLVCVCVYIIIVRMNYKNYIVQE
ncbi:hypothetical protein TSAR_008163 [Trichomalopsis sarcophagae]|uniref:Uncharacterized protein n=1 Tax=Trichomalopsis sarcophagae TaxID=543379 RepID=A0A232EUQ5_9HYME|nr:hypothetical protein TSAR_008163 [Trichomalopsis sarcophagae]